MEGILPHHWIFYSIAAAALLLGFINFLKWLRGEAPQSNSPVSEQQGKGRDRMKLGNILKSKPFLAVVFFLGLLLASAPREYVSGSDSRHVITYIGIVMMALTGYFFWRLEKNPLKSKPFLAVVFFLGLYIVMGVAQDLVYFLYVTQGLVYFLPEALPGFIGIMMMMVTGYFFWKLEKKS